MGELLQEMGYKEGSVLCPEGVTAVLQEEGTPPEGRS